jgi:hypothetical protein
MSDLVPDSPFGGIVRIVKLTNGDELLGIVKDVSADKIVITLPAKLETAFSRDKDNNLIEYVKLTNYAANIQNYEIILNRSSILYMGSPIPDLNKMYDAFFITMQKDPTSIITNGNDEIMIGPEAGLQMLNELFNNEDFVNFVNDLIDSFEAEGVLNEIMDDEGGGEESEEDNIQNLLSDASINDLTPEESPKPPKKKKRSKMKPRSTEIPFNPEANPNSAEGWSDNPEDYI